MAYPQALKKIDFAWQPGFGGSMALLVTLSVICPVCNTPVWINGGEGLVIAVELRDGEDIRMVWYQRPEGLPSQILCDDPNQVKDCCGIFFGVTTATLHHIKEEAQKFVARAASVAA